MAQPLLLGQAPNGGFMIAAAACGASDKQFSGEKRHGNGLFNQGPFSSESSGADQQPSGVLDVSSGSPHAGPKQLPVVAVNGADVAGPGRPKAPSPALLTPTASSPLAVHSFSPFLTVSDISHASWAHEELGRGTGKHHVRPNTLPAPGPTASDTPPLHPVLLEFFNSLPTATHPAGSAGQFCHTAPTCISGTGSPYQTVSVFALPSTDAALLDSMCMPSGTASAVDEDWDDMEAQMLLTGSDFAEVAVAQQQQAQSSNNKTSSKGSRKGPAAGAGPHGPLASLWQKVQQANAAQLAPRLSANQPAAVKLQAGFKCSKLE